MGRKEMDDATGPTDAAFGGDSSIQRYAAGNIREDGSYKVGKGRTPEHTRFREGDGRGRGRRPKGQRNFDTEFEEESRRLISVRENGKTRRVNKVRGTIIRVFDSAAAKGDPRAQSLVFSHAARISDKKAPHGPGLSVNDDEELNAWLGERLALIQESEPDERENSASIRSPTVEGTGRD